MTTASDRMTKARTRLMFNPYAWYGSLALRLTLVEDQSIPTMCTDGTTLNYNPDFVAKLSDPELVFGVAHEVSHCALLHMYPERQGDREDDLWNQAGDYAINLMLRDSQFTIPDGVLIDDQYLGMSAEEVYSKLQQQQQPKQQPQPGKGQSGQQSTQNTPGGGSGSGGPGSGEQSPCFTPAPDPNSKPAGATEPQPLTAHDWQILAEQAAMMARKAGQLSADTERAISANREPQIDWRTILRRFIEQVVPSDYSWTSPNRRYVSAGLYLPGMVKENTPKIAVAIDTSGSINEQMLNAFAAELTDIVREVRPTSVEVVYCDSSIKGTQTFTADDPEIVLEARGGGGTAFQPVFDWLAEQDEPPACLVFATDLMSSDTPDEPDVPVLWLTPEWITLEAPFGEQVALPIRAAR